jgi:transcriptional regulator with XRE-family HTH domain
MELNGKKQIDVARELGIPKSTLSRYLKGSYEPKTERVYQLSEYFGVTPEWLMGYTNDPQGHVMENNTDMGKQVYSSDDDTFLIAEKEIMLVQAYRQHEQLQRVIDKILDLSGETRKSFKVARVEKK